jgi:hypothetical protein
MAPYKSSAGRNLGKLVKSYLTGSIGGGIGAGGGTSLIVTGGQTTEPGNGYKYHTFLSNGAFVTTGDIAAVDVLMVAGGGGGGSGGGGTGGGGGAGGVRFYPGLPVAEGEYNIVIGQGGNGAAAYNSGGSRGGDTTAFGKTANGGGHTNYNSAPQAPGGSGAGASYGAGSGTGNVGGDDPLASPVREGYNGGGGGGGGAGENGQPTAGGNGIQLPDFTGPLIGQPALAPYNGYYGGGGGTGKDGTNGAPGGNGGGGNGQSRNAPNNGTVTDGVDGLGGGGGGGSNVGAGDGGKGIVVVRYAV